MDKTRKGHDVIIVGGGVMGCAIAYHLLASDPRLRVAVVERDPTYARASTTLSMANARIQFSFTPNILISQHAFAVFERFGEEMAIADHGPDISFRREGNLFLVDEDGHPGAAAALAKQRGLGCAVEWWSPEEIVAGFPLYEPSGFVGGSFGPDDGHFDAYAVLMGYRAKALSLGSVFISDEVIGISTTNGRVSGVSLASGTTLSAGVVVNCAGAWAAEVAATAGVILPVKPIKRQVFVVDSAVKPEAPLPLTVLPSGLYFRTETGGLLLVGRSLASDPVGFDLTWDEQRFVDVLWPELATFVPAFERLKVKRGWAGLYAVNTLDGNAILGQWPGLRGLFLANGFSGHGLQQAPAIGRYLSELILGQQPTLDLAVFGPERILQNHPLSETGLV